MHGQLLYCLYSLRPVKHDGIQRLDGSEGSLISEGEVITAKNGRATPSFLKGEFLLTLPSLLPHLHRRVRILIYNIC